MAMAPAPRTEPLPPPGEPGGTVLLPPELRWLLSCAGDQVGLSLLVALGHEPGACDTPSGFARRVHLPLLEVIPALDSLHRAGVLSRSPSPGRSGEEAYWLSAAPPICACLREFVRLYNSGPAGRRQLIRALPALCPLAA